MTHNFFLHIPGRFSSLPQPIVDLSPIRRSASSLTQHHQDARLKDFDLERPDLTQSSMGAGQVRSQDRAHHHHHHHRCHRRRDKDKEKKQRSLERTVQPSSTVGEEDRFSIFLQRLWQFFSVHIPCFFPPLFYVVLLCTVGLLRLLVFNT